MLTALTKAMNQAMVDGLPEAWTLRKLVPIHKEGIKEDAQNYRTVMVASIFAKVLGGLLEARLGKWAEIQLKRASSQAGFRHNYSTMDHILCLRVLGEKAKLSHRPL